MTMDLSWVDLGLVLVDYFLLVGLAPLMVNRFLIRPFNLGEGPGLMVFIIFNMIYFDSLFIDYKWEVDILKNITMANIFLALGLGLILNVFINRIFSGLVEKISPGSFSKYRKKYDQELEEPSTSLFINMCLVAPVFEELLTRAFILEGLVHLGEARAILISSLVFALIHFNLAQGLMAFLAGLVLGLLYLGTDSLFTVILCHGAFNFISFLKYYNLREEVDMKTNKRFKFFRENMKSRFAKDFTSDQQEGREQPALTKPYDRSGTIIDLPDPSEEVIRKESIHTCLRDRRTNRLYGEEAVSLDQLSYLLWASQGVRGIRGDNYATERTVPSAGARHSFESYIIASRVEGLEPGVYRYLPLEHKLYLEYREDKIGDRLIDCVNKQVFVADAALCIFWSCLPYRGEWRFDTLSHKLMLIDLGHVCQNLYLACEALDLGTCAMADYHQKRSDDLLGLDGEEEFVVYMAPVGVKR